MIVPSMTLEEIRKEIEKDYPILIRKMTYVAQDLEKTEQSRQEKGFERFYDYCSKYKNQWIYRLHITKKVSECAAMLVYHSGKGHAAITASAEMSIIYHTGHFFERYNERCKLGLKTINDIIRAYMSENNIYDFQRIEEIEQGIFKIFCLIQSGIIGNI